MAVKLRFMSAIIRKDAIAEHFPGGDHAFRKTFQPEIEDEGLYALCSMSSGELEEIVETLRSSGFDTDRHVAIGDMWAGPFHEVSGIVFETEHTDAVFPQWFARCAA
jgi:hypothetical protein